ncbi:DNA repair protein XRCC2 [Cataglyphis hispanica]|uniref:DNA repair protein XRCC2 n=1 Tax=Cataglyphis hispanica TaxID=1086592 RepID=UPI00217FC06D|nr:DNA repair protein XRCC2 [Cataglyphis hispanica]
MQFHSEGGLELLSRFREKRRSVNLDRSIFSNDISDRSVVEIVGASSTGKTLLLCQFIAKCILPVWYKGIKIDGCDSCAILIDTLGQIQITKFTTLMTVMIRTAYETAGVQPPVETIDLIVNKSLENLTVIDCCNNDQLHLSLHALENDLLSDERIALLAIDNILAYYWQMRREKGILGMDQYARSLVRIIRTRISQFCDVTVYTRWNESVFRNETTVTSLNSPKRTDLLKETDVNYRLQLCKSFVVREFICHVQSMNDRKQIRYTISDSGIKWIL